MNTNALKKFAQNARKKLMDQVESRLDYVLNTDSAELRERQNQIDELKKELKRTGRKELIDKVAYTWFNRLVALRFMDVNDYQPFRIRVISPHEGYTQPELLTEAKQGHIPDELEVDRQRINDLLNGSFASQNPQNEVFRLLLVAACNHLNSIFPFLFEPIEDYTELLLPEDLTSEYSIVQDVRDGMPAEACKAVEVIGWLYQFYISEKKDEVFASSGKVKKEEIPAATQLFTPRWIVEYMVQNTIGKLWLQNNPDSSLKEHMDYYIESPSAEVEEYLEIDSPEDITFLDPACGSGHILVYAFELLTKIYEEAGYPQSDIAELILTKNLHGIEIDERAAQLSGLSLMMKARDYYRRTFRKDLTPNVTCLTDLSLSEKEIKEVCDKEEIDLTEELQHDLTNMQQATNYGSLIIPHTDQSTLGKFYKKLSGASSDDDLFEAEHKLALKEAIDQLLTLGKEYHCVAANPPYMGSGKMNKSLKKFARSSYSNSYSDLMACFMERGLEQTCGNGFLGMINQHSWMFLTSYENSRSNLRTKIIDNYLIDSLLHLGPRTFKEITGEVVQNAAFSIINQKPKSEGSYIRLVDFKDPELKRINAFKAINNENESIFYQIHQKEFREIPGKPFAYWIDDSFRKLLVSHSLGEHGDAREGLSTGRNKEHIREWTEVSVSEIFFGCESTDESKKDSRKWYPHNKDGSFRKWYGNIHQIVNWQKNGKLLRNRKHPSGNRTWAHNFNLEYIFKPFITWSSFGSKLLSARYFEQGFIFDSVGLSYFPEDEKYTNLILGFVNSKLGNKSAQMINPTMSFKPGYFEKLPYPQDAENFYDDINKLVTECISIAKREWTSRETSWNFDQNELILQRSEDLINIEEAYDLYKQYWKVKFSQLHDNERKLNEKFIEIYGLEEDLDPKIPLENITILEGETKDKNGEIKFKGKEVFSQFISYAVGCMFGRYSLDKKGLILANKGETLEDYLRKVEKSEEELTFLPDDDNIIPVLDEDWFEDDIVGRFRTFLKASFGEENFEMNLAFVEEHITHGDIRKYFNKTFNSDHYKRYNKRPIYWMFSSPNGVFKALIYMHRYTPDTLNRMLNDYLREYKSKLTYRKDHLQEIINSSSDAGEVNKAEKEQRKLEEMLRELEEYERNVLMPLATDRIDIDLDDGVLVNYNKFGKAVEEIKSVNDKKKKKSVKEFDWIDSSEIR